ncbi:MAG: EAL domain-containing protein [Lachnospiraceae bacterium]|nr:EAL domain-containing protein [Lachnospiraceae bacterium]
MRTRRMLWFALCLFIALNAMQPVPINAQESEKKIVRVGWFDSAYNNMDEFGRRSGYGYEYQKRISIYTGWTYEYVTGSGSELFEMLMAGEIDLLSDVSYTPERAEKILYSFEAMGAESYHVFIAPDNTEIRPDDLSSLNGKRVVVNKSGIQTQLFIDWSKEHNISSEIIESQEYDLEMISKVISGEYDAVITLDTYGNSTNVIPVWKIGSSEFFFGINKNRPDLKEDLDEAMNRLFEEDRDFNQHLAEDYSKSSALNNFLTAKEIEWLADHDTIKVGYLDNYLPFCDMDESTHLLTGTLQDYLTSAKTRIKNASLEFETLPFTSVMDALTALTAGEIDCIFPLSISAYDAEKYAVIVTDPLINAEVYLAVRNAEHKGLDRNTEKTVAIVEGNPNFEAFLMDNFPGWNIAYYQNGQSALEAVAKGEADAELINSYRISQVTGLLEKYKLSALATGEYMGMSFGVNEADDCLYSILNKITRMTTNDTLNASLTSYGFRDDKVTFTQFVRKYLIHIIATAAIIAVIFLLLILRNFKTQAKMMEGRRIISETERDNLTELYNWNYFLVYANRLYHEHRETPMDAADLNINQFHSVNALHGRELGDDVLRTLGSEIKSFLTETEGIASRFAADRFDIYCAHRDDWQDVLDRFQKKLDSLYHGADIRLRMGVKPWEKGMEPIMQFDRARTACNKLRGDFKSQIQIMIYDSEMGKKEEREQKLLNDLSRALNENELIVYYQPKYNIQAETPTLSSAEALIRWQHPELGMIPPSEFIPLFERRGQIYKLDNYVWTSAAKQIAFWRDKYGITLPVSVNLSRVDVFDPALESTLDSLIDKNGLNHSDLKLEITESAYTENAEHLIRVIKLLRSKGYEIEMDDFGSGYSSLNMLSSMPIDVLKIDIGFIRNIERNERDLHLVRLIIDIARNLKVPVVAEGVENEKQLMLLKDAGCNLVQGYYFSRPLPPAEFEETFFASADK